MLNHNIAIRHLLRIADTKITYLTDILLFHSQRLKEEEHTYDAVTDTASPTIASGPASIPTFPDALRYL